LTLDERSVDVKDIVLRLSIDEGRGLTKISRSLVFKIQRMNTTTLFLQA